MPEQSVFKEEVRTGLKRPRMYKVLLFNDDYTTMEFVIKVLVEIFHKSAAEATKIMLDVHEKGKGLVGLYPYDIAVTKVAQVEEMAGENQYPLKAGVEAE